MAQKQIKNNLNPSSPSTPPSPFVDLTAKPIREWLVGGAEMAQRIRTFNWANTPLGPAETWSPALRMMVRFLLANRFPLLLWWGPQYISIYNDAYAPVLGAKHPWALGQSVRECWKEIWHVLKPLIDPPFQGGPSTWDEDLCVEINRHGFLEEAHFTVAYSPVPDETVASGIGGVLATVHEITEKVLAERRALALRDLGAQVAEAKTAEDACRTAAEILAKHSQDVPFALLYLKKGGQNQMYLAGASGTPENSLLSPYILECDQSTQLWPVAEVIQSHTIRIVNDLSGRFGAAIPQGPWSDAPRQAVILPIRLNMARELAGVLIFGISARLQWNDMYSNFFELVSGQIATAVANARAYEEEHTRANALAELDRAKTQFFSNVSHEFRTPLTLMLGPLEDTLAHGVHNLNPEISKNIEVVHRNSLRLLRLVNTLLDFSRIEAGRVEASYEPTDLATLTMELSSVFRSTIEKAGLTFKVDCPSLPEPIYVDRQMWEKIVFNLLSNAFKFTFKGEISVKLRVRKKSVVLYVSDTGIGISQSNLSKIFERFHRVKDARARTHEGTGIGLSLVEELTRLHGGKASVQSQEGLGSIFMVTIPLGNNHLPDGHINARRQLDSTSAGAAPFVEEALRWVPQNDSPEQTDHGNRQEAATLRDAKARILVVDDNADMRDYFYRLLFRQYSVEMAADGQAAWESIQASAPDLVLSDVMMPRMDGLGLIQRIRADERIRTMPVILVSAHAGEEARVEGMAAGVDDYLIKPFSAKELSARVEAHLNLARLRQEANDWLRRSKEQTAADLQAMTRLHEVGVKCAQRDCNVKDCLEAIVETAIATTRADKGTVHLFDPICGALVMTAHRGFKEPFLNFFAKVTKESSACGAAMQDGQRVVVQDVTKSPIFFGPDALTVLLDAKVRAVQSTPLVSSVGHLLGMISTHYEAAHCPSDTELRRMDLLARQTADFLERKKAESDLRRSEEELSDFFENAAIGVHWMSSEGIILRANRTELNLFGYSPDEYIGHSVTEFYVDKSAVKEILQQLKDGKEICEYETTIRCKDGSLKDVLINSNVLWDDGQFIHSRCLTRDITDRKRVQGALRESEERFRALVNATSDVIFRTSPDWKEMRQLNGRDFIADTLEPSRRWMEKYIPPADHPRLMKKIRSAIQSKGIFELEHRVIRLDGSIGWTHSRAIPMVDGAGQIVEWFGAASNVTPRKELEESLRDREKYFHTLADNISQLVWICDEIGNVTWYNKRWLDYTGLTFEKMGEWSWKNVLHPDHIDRVLKSMATAQKSGEVWEETFPLRGKDGQYCWFLSRAMPIRSQDGPIMRWFVTNTDITERKLAEEEIRHYTEELKRSNRDLEQFASVASHDLKEPLRIVSAYSDLLSKRYKDKLDSRADEYIGNILKSTGRMGNLIHDLLSFSKVRKDGKNFKPIDSSRAVEKALKNL
ncbi:MAG: PAS domain S-box protein, partial [Candidatus Omnitrophica bacterium]|nr:PAS domain S-box protein [Candidatus Omnitrophota bacterium]